MEMTGQVAIITGEILHVDGGHTAHLRDCRTAVLARLLAGCAVEVLDDTRARPPEPWPAAPAPPTSSTPTSSTAPSGAATSSSAPARTT
jgi:hypothetical protein